MVNNVVTQDCDITKHFVVFVYFFHFEVIEYQIFVNVDLPLLNYYVYISMVTLYIYVNEFENNLEILHF